MSTLAINVLSAHSLLSSFGAVGVGVVLFAETGLLIGFFLPGDSLLFTAGVLCAAKASSSLHLSLWQVLLMSALGACIGAQTGYVLGRTVGPALFADARRARLRDGRDRAEAYLDRYGHGKAIVLARFVPVVRTVLNPLAGIVDVPVRVFTFWQVVGGVVWTFGVVLAGDLLGSHITNIDHYLLPIIAVVVVVSLIPLALEIASSRKRTP